MTVTVVTAAVPRRVDTFLRECIASVEAQTHRATAHIIGIDTGRRGHGPILNDMLCGLSSEFVVLLADDDTLYPTHLERCLAAIGDADVCYPYADLSSWPEGSPQRAVINRPWDAHAIRYTNWIPGGGALIRTSALRRVGGLSEDPARFHDSDWQMWRDIAATGGAFVCIPEPLWFYRCHDHQLQAIVDGRRTTSLEEIQR